MLELSHTCRVIDGGEGCAKLPVAEARYQSEIPVLATDEGLEEAAMLVGEVRIGDGSDFRNDDVGSEDRSFRRSGSRPSAAGHASPCRDTETVGQEAGGGSRDALVAGGAAGGHRSPPRRIARRLLPIRRRVGGAWPPRRERSPRGACCGRLRRYWEVGPDR